MMDDSVTSGGGKGRGSDGGAQDSDLLDDSVLRETENQMLDVLLSSFQRDKGETNFRLKFDEMARTECMIAKENLINVCKSSRYCHNSDSMRLSVEEMCMEYDELVEMSYHAAEQLLVILGVCCLCFVLYMALLLIESIVTHFFGTDPPGE